MVPALLALIHGAETVQNSVSYYTWLSVTST